MVQRTAFYELFLLREIIKVTGLTLKRLFIDFTHDVQFIHHEEYDSTSENSC